MWRDGRLDLTALQRRLANPRTAAEAAASFLVFDVLERYEPRAVLHEEFCGAEFSEGDGWISRVAQDPTASCGNPERWRRTATNHHLSFVTDRLATRRAS